MKSWVIIDEFWSRQEGWRLEPEDLSDPNSPIIFKGVVFNEMKGAMVSRWWSRDLDLNQGIHVQVLLA